MRMRRKSCKRRCSSFRLTLRAHAMKKPYKVANTTTMEMPKMRKQITATCAKTNVTKIKGSIGTPKAVLGDVQPL